MTQNRGSASRSLLPRKTKGAFGPGLRRPLLVGAGIVLMAGLVATLPGIGRAAANAPRGHRVAPRTDDSPHFAFETLGDPADKTFNRLLGINDFDEIAGYYGSGKPATVHPNRGFVVSPFSGLTFRREGFPGSQQTQVAGVNDGGTTVGSFTVKEGGEYGFMLRAGKYIRVADPLTASRPAVNQLLGLNNESMAAGFYEDAQKNRHAYVWARVGNQFTPVDPPGAVSATATGINDLDGVSGFFTDGSGDTSGFVQFKSAFTVLQFPGATKTEALALNDNGQVVGTYVDTAGKTHGFVWVPPLIITRTAGPRIPAGTYTEVDDPAGVGTTTVEGINNVGTLVGFYVDHKGNTDGLIGFLRPPGTPGS
jgi:probable HAF family extracellular repeat protein